MNKEIIKILNERNIHPISYQKINNVYVINNHYAIKLNTNNYDIYKYLTSKDFCYFRNYEFVCIENALLFGFMMMLLLAILLTRRNIGDDNIIVKIKNNRLARLI